jgi:hypothetical protein
MYTLVHQAVAALHAQQHLQQPGLLVWIAAGQSLHHDGQGPDELQGHVG